MPDECRLDVVVAKERLFEREDAKQLIDEFLDQPHPPLAPGPDLRSHVVEDGNILAVQLASQPQVKIGRVGQDGKPRFLAPGRGGQAPELAPDARDVSDNLEDPHDGQLLGSHDGPHPGFPQMTARAAEEFSFRKLLSQGLNKLGAVAISRGLTGRNQNLHSRDSSVSNLGDAARGRAAIGPKGF